jgi:serine phosphatase RsbU (regulator of sigma subunit)
MAKKKRLDIWKNMEPASINRMAWAVFFLFVAFEFIIIMMESTVQPLPWMRVLLKPLAMGGFAASMVRIRGSMWKTILMIVAWVTIFSLVSGGLSFEFQDSKFRVFSGLDPHDANWDSAMTLQRTTPDQLDAMFAQRGIVGMLGMASLLVAYGLIIRAMRREVRQRTRLETEVNIARDIQQSLLPKVAFRNSRCEIVGVTIPATEVGGDYFDTVALGEDTVVVAIADVTGHGIGAGILAAMTKSALRSQLAHDSSPEAVLNNLNRTVAQVADKKTFVTFGYIQLEGSQLRYGTAGHPPMLLKRGGGGVELLRTPNVGLGMRDDTVFHEEHLTPSAGDVLILYTDGASEATDAKGEQFGMERIEHSLRMTNGSAEQFCAALLKDLRAFRGGDSFEDDISIVCVKFL